MEVSLLSFVSLILALTLVSRTNTGFKFRPKYSIAVCAIWITARFLLAGGTPQDIYDAYVHFARGYMADFPHGEDNQG